jgi:hypothetical protein
MKPSLPCDPIQPATDLVAKQCLRVQLVPVMIGGRM